MKTRPMIMATAIWLLGCGGSGTPQQTGQDAAEARADAGSEVKLPDRVVLPDSQDQDGPEEVPPEVLPDARGDEVSPACQPGEGCFLDKCTANAQCQSGWCVLHRGEGVCSQICQEECPPGWSCKQVAGTDPDVVYICVSAHANLCRPCATTGDCTSTGGMMDACVSYGPDGSFCGSPCKVKEDCPWGFSCKEVLTVEGSPVVQCVNDAGECPCTDSSVTLGATTPCTRTNEFGTCTGKRTCTAEGLAPCDAAIPAAETCNGANDDCDAETDEPTLKDGKYLELCDDGNGCTEDQCAGQDGCLNLVLATGDCSDANPCTIADHCADGTCLGQPVDCDDGDPCTDDLCTAAGGCEHPLNSLACDDGNPCTVGDLCVQGLCTGAVLPCACQTDADCGLLEDGDLCNGTLVCDTAALPYQCVVAAGSQVTCPEPDGPDAFCLKPACDPATGNCLFEPHNDGLLCEPSDQCTVSTHCQAGACTGGTAVNCNDGNLCTDDSCGPTSGCEHVPNDLSCQDGSVCTLGDHCADGVCVPGGGQLGCDDGKPCTTDSCDPDLGCLHTPTADPCDDGDLCTQGDHCEAGLCISTGPTECDDTQVCTTDYCDPKAGCVFAFNQAPCNDGDACTLLDVCQQGQCTGSVPPDCDDDNPCTLDGCKSEWGCTHSFVDGDPDGPDPCLVPGKSGPCAQGEMMCVAGSLTCVQLVFPLAESCDGKDNDCDGQVDGQAMDCSNACNAGKRFCTSGQWGSCDAPPPECTQGPCCDGCNFLPPGTPCGTGLACLAAECKPVCGDGLCVAGETHDTCPGDCKSLLVNGVHTEDQCTAQGGTVVDNMCRFNAGACPAGWTQYQSWTTTNPASPCSCNCNGSGCCSGAFVATHLYGCGTPVATCTGHAWGNTPVEQIHAGAKAGGCACYDCCTCYIFAKIVQIGCY